MNKFDKLKFMHHSDNLRLHYYAQPGDTTISFILIFTQYRIVNKEGKPDVDFDYWYEIYKDL